MVSYRAWHRGFGLFCTGVALYCRAGYKIYLQYAFERESRDDSFTECGTEIGFQIF